MLWKYLFLLFILGSAFAHPHGDDGDDDDGFPHPAPGPCASDAAVLVEHVIEECLDLSGTPGLACWDLNGNGECDLLTEDPNCDLVCDALDCQGAGGENGFHCWDLNHNHNCDIKGNA